MSDRMKRGLAMDALQRAINLRKPTVGLIHHSDRGSQYCSADYRRLVHSAGFVATAPSMAASERRNHGSPVLSSQFCNKIGQLRTRGSN
jgi:hypothetical protein